MSGKLDRVSGGQIRMLVGLFLLSVFAVHIQSTPVTAESADKPILQLPTVANVAMAKTELGAEDRGDSLRERAEQNPMEFIQYCLQHYQNTVRDYTCRFHKKELVMGKLTEAQEIEVRFREAPFSVLFHWVRNADKARRVLYVDDRWIDGDGEENAVCEPEGAIARFFAPSVRRPIHGSDAHKSSRRTIDQFGFANSLRLIIKYSEIAQARGELSLKFVGESQHDGRPTFKFERWLPYSGESGLYPDRLLVFHIDQQTLLPTSCQSFADDSGQRLLGRYEMTGVAVNVGLTAADFDEEKLGL